MDTPDIPYHVPYTFEVGKKVLVSRVPEAHAWHVYWSLAADSMVGKVVQIVEESPTAGYQCKMKGSLNAWLPSAALSIPEDKNVVIEVPSVMGV